MTKKAKDISEPGLVTAARFNDSNYPQVHVAIVHFLGDEVQIEQGGIAGEDVDVMSFNNDCISMSSTQALAIAHKIIEAIEKESN